MVKDLMLELKAAGTTIFFNTHILSDVESICDHFAIIHFGKIVANQKVSDLTGTLEDYFMEVISKTEDGIGDVIQMNMQNTFTVAIDLDETLAATFEKIFNFGSEKYGWDIPFHEAVTRHDWWKIPGLGITEAGAHELFNEYCDTDPDDSFIPLVS